MRKLEELKEWLEKIYNFFEENHSYINIREIETQIILDYMRRHYVEDKSFERQMEMLRDYILAEDLCSIEY